jgi:hypothetical protein
VKHLYSLTYILISLDIFSRFIFKNILIGYPDISQAFLLFTFALATMCLMHATIALLKAKPVTIKQQTNVILFLSIFIMSLVNPAIVIWGLNKALYDLKAEPLTDSDYAQLLYTSYNETYDQQSAELLYEKTGLLTPYKNDDGNFVVFVPTQYNTEQLVQSRLMTKEALATSEYATSVVKGNVTLLISKIFIFCTFIFGVTAQLLWKLNKQLRATIKN